MLYHQRISVALEPRKRLWW